MTIAVNEVTLVQAADGSVSHEHFEVPPWLTAAVRASTDVSVVRVEHANGNGNGNATTTPGGGNGAAQPTEAPTTAPPRALRFYLHESDDGDADRARLDALIALIEQHPGDGVVRLFIHANDGDKIELAMPPADVTEALREQGLALLGEHGGADAIDLAPKPPARRTRGVEPLEV